MPDHGDLYAEPFSAVDALVTDEQVLFNFRQFGLVDNVAEEVLLEIGIAHATFFLALR